MPEKEQPILLELWDFVWNVPFNAPMVNARLMKKVYLIVAKALGKKLIINKSFEQIERETKKKELKTAETAHFK